MAHAAAAAEGVPSRNEAIAAVKANVKVFENTGAMTNAPKTRSGLIGFMQRLAVSKKHLPRPHGVAFLLVVEAAADDDGGGGGDPTKAYMLNAANAAFPGASEMRILRPIDSGMVVEHLHGDLVAVSSADDGGGGAPILGTDKVHKAALGIEGSLEGMAVFVSTTQSMKRRINAGGSIVVFLPPDDAPVGAGTNDDEAADAGAAVNQASKIGNGTGLAVRVAARLGPVEMRLRSAGSQSGGGGDFERLTLALRLRARTVARYHDPESHAYDLAMELPLPIIKGHVSEALNLRFKEVSNKHTAFKVNVLLQQWTVKLILCCQNSSADFDGNVVDAEQVYTLQDIISETDPLGMRQALRFDGEGKVLTVLCMQVWRPDITSTLVANVTSPDDVKVAEGLQKIHEICQQDAIDAAKAAAHAGMSASEVAAVRWGSQSCAAQAAHKLASQGELLGAFPDQIFRFISNQLQLHRTAYLTGVNGYQKPPHGDSRIALCTLWLVNGAFSFEYMGPNYLARTMDAGPSGVTVQILLTNPKYAVFRDFLLRQHGTGVRLILQLVRRPENEIGELISDIISSDLAKVNHAVTQLQTFCLRTRERQQYVAQQKATKAAEDARVQSLLQSGSRRRSAPKKYDGSGS